MSEECRGMPTKVGLDARHAARGLGIGVFVTELATHLAMLGDIEVLWFGDPGERPDSTRPTGRFGRAPYPLLDSALGHQAARRLGVDVFHFTGNTGWVRSRSIPFVLTLHDLIFLDTGVRERTVRQVVGHRYERLNVRHAAAAAEAVAVPSEATAAAARRALVTENDPVVIPNGVEPPVSPSVAPHGEGYVVAFGGRDPRKRLDLALDGVLALGPDAPRLKVLAGAGVPAGFEERAEAAITSGRVELLGHLPRDGMWRVLSDASALVYPSIAEGFGMPVLEAMSVGVPVVTGLAPATSELGGDAILPIDHDEPVRSIATALRRLRTEPGLAADLSAKGRCRAGEFSWSRTAERYAALYRQVAQT
jgi:glycosyltransferase involved in cell wall biosynthesis